MRSKKGSSTKVDSRKVALALISKMVRYEQTIDSKQDKSAAEVRHVAFLRALRGSGINQ